jgi:hypothetical protein
MNRRLLGTYLRKDLPSGELEIYWEVPAPSFTSI